jgi:signal transduction histidine kinase
MIEPVPRCPSIPAPDFLKGGGDMGARMRARDWCATPLGRPEDWPQPLKTLVAVLLAAGQPMFIAWGPERLLLYNDGYAPMLGHRHPGGLGRPFFEVWHEAALAVGPLFERVFGGTPVNMDDIELHLERPGRPREAHFAFSYSPVLGVAGHVEGLFCVCTETTEQVFSRRREVQQAFQSRLVEALRPLSNAVEVQVTASEMLGEYLGANRVVYFEIVGDEYVIERDFVVDVAPLAGRYPVSSFGPEVIAALRAGRTLVEEDATAEPTRSASERASFATIDVRGHVDVPLVKSGRFVAGMTVHFKAPRAFSQQEIALIEDTAERTWASIERVRAEAALQVSEERFLFVRQRSGVGFWYCDLPFDVLAWDDLVKHHFHLPPDAVVTIDTFYDRIHPEDREPTRLAIERSIASRTPYETVYRTVHPLSAEVKWVRAIGRTFYQADGVPTRFDGVTLDVTDQKLAESDLREADRRKDEFLATLAHELRNPLAPLRNGLQILRIAEGDPAVVGRARAMMERQVEVMVRLVDELLDVARISGGKIELRCQLQSLQTVIARAVETAMPAIDAHRHALTVNAPSQPIWVDVDTARIVQVLANLIGNAAKYTPNEGQVTIDLSTAANEAIVSVADDGVGIPRDALPRVFDMFSQIGETRSMAQGGLGIGLFLAKKLVTLHGGQLSAESAGPGLGSTFSVRLPLSPAPRPPGPAAEPERPGTSSAGLRILIVDDNLDAGDSLALSLSLKHHEVKLARNGLAGLSLAKAFQADLAFLDIGMPGMNGLELADAIRRDVPGRRPLLVALTGWGSRADVEQAMQAGFDHHLTKPASEESIEEILDVARRR